MRQLVEIKVLPQEFESIHIRGVICRKLNISSEELTHFEIERKSVDARTAPVHFRLRVQTWINEAHHQTPSYHFAQRNVSESPEIHIVGLGPAGLFAALKCIELGYKPILFERGKCVRERRRDLALLTRNGIVNPNSNYCFGEGGAGTFSDGKLYTRSTKRGNIHDIYQQLVHFGASPEILMDAHPHIGTNKLPGIIENMRTYIQECGGEIHFNSRLTDIHIEQNSIKAVIINDEQVIPVSCLILATGHSARDIFRLLHAKGVMLEAKPIALGVRVEHPQQLIDEIQYHQPPPRHPNLPAAAYKWVRQVKERGVYSFCMCPGGIICPAATQQNEIVVNGWSPSKRNTRFANSGIVVQINFEDVPGYHPDDPLSILTWQEQIEHQAYQAGGGSQVAPAQRITDFIQKRLSTNLPECSYIPGLKSVPLDEFLPPGIIHRLRKGFQATGKKLRGYLTDEAVLVAVESRTSSPVRIPRDQQTLMHPQIHGLMPCGEGAGYAGGIVSAALDGIRCAQASIRLVAWL